jgi:AcrR family transcriptional regulator
MILEERLKYNTVRGRHLEAQSPRRALEPQRRTGRLRVAAIKEAGAAVIAERGFEAATMAEIAARAGAPIGSLYRFFPNKQVLRDALIQRYLELVNLALERIDDDPRTLPTRDFADALLALFVDLHVETKAIVPLLDAHSDSSTKRAQLHVAILRHIAEKLMRRNPHLPSETADNIALVLLQNMKSMVTLTTTPQGSDGSGAIAELREMTRLYLASKLQDDF